MPTKTFPAPGAFRARVLEQTKAERAVTTKLGEDAARIARRITALIEHEIASVEATGDEAGAAKLRQELTDLRARLEHLPDAQRKANDTLYRREGEVAAEVMAEFIAQVAEPAVEAAEAATRPLIDEHAPSINALVAEYTEIARWARRSGQPVPSFPSPKGTAGRILAQLVQLVRENGIE